MDEKEKGRSLYEWLALFTKLLGALGALLTVLAEIIR